jgi:hypothetical protein
VKHGEAWPVTEVVEKLLRDFVYRRIDLIASGDRVALDQTYDLSTRNEWNRHDYDWYISLIEHGYGSETQRVEIAPYGSGTTLPFAGLVSYPWPPEYVATLTTVSQRQTRWLLRLDHGVPHIVLPAFNGQVGDAIARGDHRSATSMTPTSGATHFRFDQESFATELANRITLELCMVAPQLRLDRVRAIALDCFPWNGGLSLSILTDREDFAVDRYGKWAIADWRYFNFTDTPAQPWPYARDLMEQMTAFYQQSADEERVTRADELFRACAKALTADRIAEALRQYGFKLAADFELGVFDPDHPERGNYCQPRS